MVCVLLGQKCEEVNGFSTPAVAGGLSLDDPEDSMEEYKDVWFLIGNKIDIEPMLSALGTWNTFWTRQRDCA
jgi:hypothetical protein